KHHTLYRWRRAAATWPPRSSHIPVDEWCRLDVADRRAGAIDHAHPRLAQWLADLVGHAVAPAARSSHVEFQRAAWLSPHGSGERAADLRWADQRRIEQHGRAQPDTVGVHYLDRRRVHGVRRDAHIVRAGQRR